jgi:hypothetical protein
MGFPLLLLLGDRGDLDEFDKQADEDALVHGDRIISHHKLGALSLENAFITVQ